jgi:purine-binding chemotaxis protein CheW
MATGPDIQTTSGSNRELLSFRIADQEFCIDIMAVREIRGWTPTTPLPFAPSYMRGVVNLRGKVMPIIDLAERLGLPIVEPTPQHVIIVAELGNQTAGLLVSAVCDILSMSDAVIQDVPDVASGIVRMHLLGLLTVNDRMVGLLSTDQIVPAAVAAQIEGAVEPLAA